MADKFPRLGFIGLGHMGLPMAQRLVQAGHDVRVWNRSTQGLNEARAAGARAVGHVCELFETSEVILIALANEDATDEVLGRTKDRLQVVVKNRALIQLGTTSPAHSRLLAMAVEASGGRYIEAPVSGSKKPAEDGMLIGLLGAACENDFLLAEHILAPLTARVFRCGPPGSAMTMKLAVNNFLITMVMGLAEAWSLADRLGLDLAAFRDVLDAGPMASAVSRIKLQKLAEDDMRAQASISDVLMNAQLVADLALEAAFPLSLGERCEGLLTRAVVQGLGSQDMIAVAKIAGMPDGLVLPVSR